MEVPVFDRVLYDTLHDLAKQIEDILDADVFMYRGEINPICKTFYLQEMEKLASECKHNKLAFNITTPGGTAEAVEVMVEIMRHFYKEVYFIIADYAYSAGTILCMSGDKIYMDYSSSLGPIDPQVYSKGKLIPAQGYLDQFNKILKKSEDGTITPLEIQIIRDMDVGDLHFYEQARNLTITLLKQWLVKYKFKDWNNHKDGRPVTYAEKETRAEEIAKKLGDNSYWHSHGRHIGIETLKNVLKLKIEDYSLNKDLADLIKKYNTLGEQFATKQGWPTFIHSRTII